jgi:tyrosyl-tRNA synthetase
MFFKSKSDKLSLYQLYNYKIKLKGDNIFRYSLLYKITTAELKTIKEYLINNLNKGFIKASQALYITPVPFVKKPDKSL